MMSSKWSTALIGSVFALASLAVSAEGPQLSTASASVRDPILIRALRLDSGGGNLLTGFCSWDCPDGTSGITVTGGAAKCWQVCAAACANHGGSPVCAWEPVGGQ